MRSLPFCVLGNAITSRMLGVPVRIGANGLEKVVEVELSAEEKKMLDNSADAVKELIEAGSKL